MTKDSTDGDSRQSLRSIAPARPRGRPPLAKTQTDALNEMSPEDAQLMKEASSPRYDLDEVLENLTEMEKNYCRIMVTQNPKSKAEAMKRAGSKADAKYLSKMAWELEQRPHVLAYMEHLRATVIESLGISLEEIVANARKGIEIAFQQGKPKDADPHNRLLAELGGFIRNSTAVPTGAAKIAVKVENNLKGDDVNEDFKKFLQISGMKGKDNRL